MAIRVKKGVEKNKMTEAHPHDLILVLVTFFFIPVILKLSPKLGIALQEQLELPDIPTADGQLDNTGRKFHRRVSSRDGLFEM